MGIKLSKLPKGSIPVTGPDLPLQLVSLKHPKGSFLKPHLHKKLRRVTNLSETCFVVKKGKVRIDLYTPDKIFFKYIVLSPGQVFISSNGSGHSIKMLKDSEILEIKNGPFLEDKILIEE